MEQTQPEQTAEAEVSSTETAEAEVRHVDKVAYDSVKADMIKYKTQMRDLQEKLDSMAAEKQKVTEDKLSSQQKYKELSELYKTEAEKAKAQSMELKDAWVADKKYQAIEREALKMGANPDGLDYIMTKIADKVQVDVSGDQVHVVGAVEYLEELKSKDTINLFGSGRPPKVNSKPVSVGNTDQKKLTGKEMLDLSRTDPAAYAELAKQQFRIKI